MQSFKVGAHMSIAGGISKAPSRLKKIGGSILQIFSSSPRTWKGPDVSDEEVRLFKEECEKHGVDQTFIHAKYLVSLGNTNTEILDKSINSLREDLELSKRIGAEGVIFHPRGESFNLMISSMLKILDETSTNLIVEGTAQSDISETGRIFSKIKSDRLLFCLDTAHAFEAGHDFSTSKKLDDLLDLISSEIGLERLVVVHANDSRTKLGSKHDQHADIGEGEVGIGSFSLLVNHPKTKNLPFILEVPALKDGEEPSKENVNRLKLLQKR